jgi:hypothetical protein
MRFLLLYVSLLLITISNIKHVIGQTTQTIEPSNKNGDQLRDVHIHDIINTEEFRSSAIKNTRLYNPSLFIHAMQKARSSDEEWTYEVGDEQTFYVLRFDDRSDSLTGGGWFDEVVARLMAIGDFSRVWVSVDELDFGHVTQAEIDIIIDAIENHTPPLSKNPDKGIFELINEYFGAPPNIDHKGNKNAGDGKTDILLTDIQDGWSPLNEGEYIPGFFYIHDQGVGEFSNRRDIIYIDTYPGIYNPSKGERNTLRPLSTLAHQYQHLVFHNYRGTSAEETWLNEGLSEYAETVCGYSLRSPMPYFMNTNRSMNHWENKISQSELQDYSRVALWTKYIAEQMGDEFIRHIVQLPENFGRGESIVNRAAQEIGSDLRFSDLFRNFTRANIIKDNSVDERYGYSYSFGGRPEPLQYHNDPNVIRSNFNIQSNAAYYIEYDFGDSLGIIFTSPSDVTITAIEFGADKVNIVPIGLGETYQQWDYGTRYRSIMFIITNTSASDATLSYESTGGFRYYVDEYAFDDGTPRAFSGQASYLGFPGGESYNGAGWAVRFTPEFPENILIGARIYAMFEQEFDSSVPPLDSRKSFLFHVWGDNDGKPGRELIEPFPVETDRVDYPATFLDVDLMAYANELTNLREPIYIGFTHNTNYSVYVGMTDLLQSSNRTFYTLPPNFMNGEIIWGDLFDLSVGDGVSLQGWNMMMRAIFAVYDPDRVTLELIERDRIPGDYVLYQNFPNPFNSTTIIRYGIPIRSYVQLTLYNTLGQEIKILVNREQEAGTHKITLEIADLPSGVYIYRLQAGEYTESKKLLLLK